MRIQQYGIGPSLARALVAMPLAIQFLVVRFFGVNVLIGDEWYYVDLIRQARNGENWLPWLLLQHNEHRVVPMKLLMVPLALLTRWNLVAEMYFSAFLAGLILFGLWQIYRRSVGDDLLLFAPVAWLVCNLAQYENMLYGMMMCFYLTVLGVVWAMVFLAWRNLRGLCLALVCGFMASFSTLNGFIVWPVGLFLLVVWRDRLWWIALWVAGGLGSALLYFHNFQIAPNTHPVAINADGLYRVARFTLTLLGAPLGAGSVAWSAVMGLVLTGLCCKTLVGWWKNGRERVSGEALPAALVLFSVLSCGVIAVGRASELSGAVISRYIAFSSLGLAGAYLLIASGIRHRLSPAHPSFVATFALLVPGLLAANLYGFHQAKEWSTVGLRQRFLLQTFDQQPDDALRGLGVLSEVRTKAPYLRRERLTAFAEPQDLREVVPPSGVPQ